MLISSLSSFSMGLLAPLPLQTGPLLTNNNAISYAVLHLFMSTSRELHLLK